MYIKQCFSYHNVSQSHLGIVMGSRSDLIDLNSNQLQMMLKLLVHGPHSEEET